MDRDPRVKSWRSIAAASVSSSPRSERRSSGTATRTAIAGIFVIHEPLGNRAITYAHDPVGVVEALALGETAIIPTVENSTIRNRHRRLAFDTAVRFRACGTVSVEGRPVAVRVYDVSTARRVVERSGKDALRYSGVTYYLSSETGYPMIFQDSETTTAVEISRS